MRKRYQLLLLAALASVGACTSEVPKETAQQPALPPAAAPAPLENVVPEAEPTPAQVESSSAKGRVAPRRPRPTTLAAAPTAGPADTAAMAELRSYLQAALPAAQQFTIRPGRDTMLVAAQGTQVLLPADAWDLPAGSAPVQLKVQEFYTPADMVLAGLSTMAGDQLLETGGMLRLTATAAGQPVRLRPGRFVHLRLPARQRKPGMELFEGEVQGADQHVNWHLPTAHLAPKAATAALAKPKRRSGRGRWQRPSSSPTEAVQPDSSIARPETAWPQYRDFEQAWMGEFKNHYERTEKLRRRRNASFRVQRLLKDYSNLNIRYTRLVSFSIIVDSSGALTTVTPNRGSDPELTPAAQTALLSLKRWQPARFAATRQGQLTTEPIAATSMVQLLFTKEGGMSARGLRWHIARASSPRTRQLRHEVDSLVADAGFKRRYFQEASTRAAAQLAQQKAYWEGRQAQAAAERARLLTQFSDTSTARISAGGVYEELSAQGLGWINCDRFTGPVPQVAFNVKVGADGAITTLLFRNIRSVMPGAALSSSEARFTKVPLGRPVTVVALRREKGVTYLATHSTLASPKTQRLPAFQAVTIAELRARLNELM